ncbi:MAG: metal-sensing transcriptional repressor [Treponema sp.]|nr:metal-sensing transcriptional repressor [Treponema sp.]
MARSTGAKSSNRTKKRTEEEEKALTNRLNRAIGQLNGIKRMLENDAYCQDILVQTTAATAAINSFSKLLISYHLKSCVKNDLLKGDESSLDEFLKTLEKMLK